MKSNNDDSVDRYTLKKNKVMIFKEIENTGQKFYSIC